jgi:hypothetical protein
LRFLAALAAVALVAAILVWPYSPELRDFIGPWLAVMRIWSHPPLAVVAGVVALPLVLVGCFIAASVKASVVRRLIEVLEFRTCSPADFPGLDEHDLAKYTQALEALGFRHLTDYTLVKAHDNGLNGFARLFVHDSLRCFAEVNGVFNARGPVNSLGCNLETFLEDSWSVSTCNRPARPGNYFLRRPRALWTKLPDRAPSQLLEAHREACDRVARDLGLAVVGDGSAEDYFRREAQANRERCGRVRSRPAWRFVLDAWLFEASPKLEWPGDYAKIARQRHGQG